MPARAHKRAAASGLSAEAFIEVASDPERYNGMLAEFTDRKGAAEQAEAQAREQIAASEAAEQRSKGQLQEMAERGEFGER